MRKLLIFLVLLLVGCASDLSEENLSETVLEGKWKTECSYRSGADWYDIITVEVVADRKSYTISNYLDSDCSMPNLSVMSTSSFKIGKEIVLTTGQYVSEIDEVRTGTFMIPESEERTKIFNEESNCIVPYVKGRPMSYKQCTGKDPIISNTEFHSIFKIDKDVLYLGDTSTGSGSTTENRPTRLSVTKYIKQQ